MSKVLIEKVGRVTTIEINRAEVRNACDARTVELLRDAFRDFDSDSEQHVAVLAGKGGSFCAGADLKELAEGKGVAFAWADETRGLTRSRLSKPVIAAVEGHAVAAGLALAVWCDLRVIDNTAVFGVFCRRYGVPMTNGASIRLPRLIGESRALDMFLTGRAVNAEEAMAIGLANRLAPRGMALREAVKLADEIAAFPQLCLRSDRTSLVGQWGMAEDEAIKREIALGQDAFREESRAGASRFVSGTGRHGRFS
jgi:enoyl-CoA hydratase